MKLSNIMSGIDVGKLKKDIEKTINDKTDGLYNDAKSGNLNPEKLEKQLGSVETLMEEAEKKMEPINKLIEAKEQIDEVKKYIDDPVAKIKEEATKRIVNYMVEKAKELPVVEDLKNQLKEEAEKKLLEIPEVKDLKDTIDEATNASVSSPSLKRAEEIADDPSTITNKKINIDAIIERAIRDSGIGPMLLRH